MKIMIYFIYQNGLWGPNDIIKRDGHVTSIITDKKFILYFDNKRLINNKDPIIELNGCVIFDSDLIGCKNTVKCYRVLVNL